MSEHFSTSETLSIPDPAHEVLKPPSALFHSYSVTTRYT